MASCPRGASLERRQIRSCSGAVTGHRTAAGEGSPITIAVEVAVPVDTTTGKAVCDPLYASAGTYSGDPAYGASTSGAALDEAIDAAPAQSGPPAPVTPPATAGTSSAPATGTSSTAAANTLAFTGYPLVRFVLGGLLLVVCGLLLALGSPAPSPPLAARGRRSALRGWMAPRPKSRPMPATRSSARRKALLGELTGRTRIPRRREVGRSADHDGARPRRREPLTSRSRTAKTFSPRPAVPTDEPVGRDTICPAVASGVDFATTPSTGHTAVATHAALPGTPPPSLLGRSRLAADADASTGASDPPHAQPLEWGSPRCHLPRPRSVPLSRVASARKCRSGRSNDRDHWEHATGRPRPNPKCLFG